MNSVNRLRAYALGALILLFGVGIVSRIVTDPNSPGVIGGFFNALAGLFKNTING